MNIREFIQKLEIEKHQLTDENKKLKEKVKELEEINSKLVDELNSYKDTDIEEVKTEPSDDENASKIEEVEEVVDETIEEEQKPKRNRRKKDSEYSVVNLM